MKTISLSLEDIYKLANKTLLTNGCDEETSNILWTSIWDEKKS